MSEIEKEVMDNQLEVGEVTITEYRKSQMARLTECFVVSPLCIYVGIRYRKELPAWLSIGLVAAGAATFLYNGSKFVQNLNRDGKLIHQAIRNKKEEEARIREQKLKSVSTPQTPAQTPAKAAEKPIEGNKKEEPKAQASGSQEKPKNGNSGSNPAPKKSTKNGGKGGKGKVVALPAGDKNEGSKTATN